MEIILNQFYNNQKVKSENNILLIFGENNSGKTIFVNNFELLLKRKTYHIFSDVQYEDTRDYLILNEEWELKKELNLQKKSYLFRFLTNNLIYFLEENNIDLIRKIKEEKEIKLILNKIKNIINSKINDYYIEPIFNFKNDFDLINLLFKLTIYDQEQNEIDEKRLSRSEQLMLYLKLLIDSNTKNKIFIFDCIDSSFNGKKLQEFANLINKLKKNNFILLTTRNPLIIRNLKISIEEILFLNKNKLERFYLNKEFLLKNYFLSDYIFEKEQIKTSELFNQKIEELKMVAEKKDYQKIEEKFIKDKLSYLLLDLDLEKKEYLGPYSFKSENEKLRDILFFRLNEIKGINREFKKLKFLDNIY